MPNVDFNQTDLTPAFAIGVYCSGRSLSALTKVSSCADEGASAGSEHLFNIATGTGASPQVCVSFCILLPEIYATIDEQTVSFSLNISVGDSTGSGSLKECFACLLDTDGTSLGVVGSNIAINASVQATGVITFDIDLAETNYSEGQALMFVLTFSNTSAMTQSTPRMTPDRTITLSLSGSPTPPETPAGDNKLKIGLGIGI